MPLVNNFYILFFLALIVSLFTGFLALFLARRVGLIDIPFSAPHKQHTHPTPIAGGIALGLGLAFFVLVSQTRLTAQFTGTLAGATIILSFGLWDDKSGQKAITKLTGQILATIIAIRSGVMIQIFGNPEFITFQSQTFNQVLNVALSLFWIVGITNALNLIDSMDGLAAGISALTFGFFILATMLSGQPQLTYWSVILFGICIGLYFWNAPQARFFLGDSGAQPIGFLLASMAILYNPVAKGQASSWFLPILLLAIPIFDTALVSYSRFKNGLPIYKGGKDHTYHRLVWLGNSPGKSVILIHIAALVIDCIAYGALFLSTVPANIIFFTLLLAGSIFVVIFERKTRSTSSGM